MLLKLEPGDKILTLGMLSRAVQNYLKSDIRSGFGLKKSDIRKSGSNSDSKFLKIWIFGLNTDQLS